MKMPKVLVLMLMVATVAVSQNEDLATWMKTANQAAGVLRKLDKKTGPDAMRSAEQLGAVYENMIGFWRQRGAADAVKWSEAGKAAVVILASAAYAGDEAKAAEAFTALSGTCRPCHEAHRETVAEGRYRIR